MANLARFLIDASPSADRGFDVNPGATPVLRLEASSSLVYRVTFEVHSAAAGAPRASSGAPTLTLTGATSGQSVDAATPASSVTLSSGIPSSRAPHLWEIRCKVNGGTNPDGSVNPDYVFSRFVAMRSIYGLRKLMYSERVEYDPIEAWASAINELVSYVPTPGLHTTTVDETTYCADPSIAGTTQKSMIESSLESTDIYLRTEGARDGQVVSIQMTYPEFGQLTVYTQTGATPTQIYLRSEPTNTTPTFVHDFVFSSTTGKWKPWRTVLSG